jgi:hypothetical protein
MGPKAVLDAVVNRKMHSPRRESNPDRPDRTLYHKMFQIKILFLMSSVFCHMLILCEPGVLSDVALGYGLEDRGFESLHGLGIFLFTTTSRTSLGPTQPPIQCVPGALFLGIKRPGREAAHSPPSSAEAKNAWN